MGVFAKIIKSYLLLGCLFDIALGIGLIVVGSLIKKTNDDLIPSDSKDIKKYVFIGFLVAGVVTILTGLLGIYAFLKNKKCL